MGTGGAQFAVVFDEVRKSVPSILHADCMKCDLQEDGRVSIAEHGVEDCHDRECIFNRNSRVDHWKRQSTWDLTDYQGVLRRSGHLGGET